MNTSSESDNSERNVHEGTTMFSGHHYYKAFNISLTWSEAEEYCTGLGGHLASIILPSNLTINKSRGIQDLKMIS